MYNGSNKIALSSQKTISQTFLTLLEEKEFSAVSVSEICKCAGISRQTFYSLFKSKEDVIAYELQRNYCFSVKEGCGSQRFSLKDLCHTYSQYIEQQHDFLKLLVEHGILDCLHESIYESFLSCEHFLKYQENPARIYAADFVAQGITSIAKNYILYGPSHDTGYLENMLYSLLSGSFFSSEHPF